MEINKDLRVTDGAYYNLDLDTIAKNTIYSTDEIVIGRWINGKPIYRKVIPFTINEYVESYHIHLPSGFGACIKLDIYTTSTASGLSHGLYRVDDTDQLRYYRGAGDIILKIGDNHPRIPWSGIVILEYTKTTD